MYAEEVYQRGMGMAMPNCRPCQASAQAYRPTNMFLAQVDPCSDGKSRLCQLNSYWCNPTISCDELRAKVCSDPTIFIGNDPVRVWANCGGPRPTGQDNTMLYVAAGGLVAVAIVAAVVISRRKRVA